jgi:hypothetical protein
MEEQEQQIPPNSIEEQIRLLDGVISRHQQEQEVIVSNGGLAEALTTGGTFTINFDSNLYSQWVTDEPQIRRVDPPRYETYSTTWINSMTSSGTFIPAYGSVPSYRYIDEYGRLSEEKEEALPAGSIFNFIKLTKD